MTYEDVKEKLVNIFEQFIAKAVTELPVDIVKVLRQAYELEES